MGTAARPALASGVHGLGTESAFSVLARARALERAGRDVLHLEIGEPDFPTPPHVVEAGCAALRAGETHYGPSAGLPELREAAAAELARTRGVAIDPERVLVGTGAKPFLFFTVLATCGPGDEVVHPDPGFPIYESAIRWAGATPVPLPLHEASDFAFDVDELAARLGPRTKLVILNSPHNPTGGVVGAERWARRRSHAAHAGLGALGRGLLAPAPRRRLRLDRERPRDARAHGRPRRASKTYAMTGWRCGYAAVPERSSSRSRASS